MEENKEPIKVKAREKLFLDKRDLRDIVYGDSEEYDVISTEITDTFRHGNKNECIVQRISDKKYFKLYYRDSVKETCEWDDMNDDDEYFEVFPIEKTIIVYE